MGSKVGHRNTGYTSNAGDSASWADLGARSELSWHLSDMADQSPAVEPAENFERVTPMELSKNPKPSDLHSQRPVTPERRQPSAEEGPTVCYSGALSSPRARCVYPPGEAQRASGEGGTTVTYETVNGECVMVTRKVVRPSPVAIPTPSSVLHGFVRAGHVKGSINAVETEIERQVREKAEKLKAKKDATDARRRARSEQRERREAEQEDEDRGRVDEEEIEQRFEAGLSADQANRTKFDNDPATTSIAAVLTGSPA